MFNKIINRIRINKWKKEGLIVGENFQLERNSFIDSSFPWMIEIGDNVTIAPDTLVLCHDGSTKKIIGYSKIGKVIIGNNVFIGAKSIILPGTRIGNNVVIAAGSVVKGKLESNYVYGGVLAHKIKSLDEYKKEQDNLLKNSKSYDLSFTKKGKITKEKKEQMKKDDNQSYVI
ncbi:MAG: acyltransferase [Bacilli bacterium]|nr:acyltransferase [Bacilli bacterium]